MLDPLVQRVQNRLGGLEIHVRHPHWDDIPTLVLRPFETVAVTSFDHAVEVETNLHAHKALNLLFAIYHLQLPADAMAYAVAPAQ